MCDGRPVEAVPIYESIEQRFPGETLACGNLGLAYERLGNRPAAMSAYARGARGGDAKAAAHLARLRQGVLPPRP
jgi:hypothetical protein